MSNGKPTLKISTSRQRQKASNFEFAFNQNNLPKPENDSLNEYHLDAWKTYQALPFPTRKDEPWRRTDFQNLAVDKFRINDGVDQRGSKKNVFSFPYRKKGGRYNGELILTGSSVHISLSDEARQSGVIFLDLKSAEAQYPELLARMIGQIVHAGDGKFAALAAAFGQNGVFLYVPKGVQLESPFYSHIWGAPAYSAGLTHSLVWLDEGASITHIHEFSSPEIDEDAQAFHAGIIEIHVGENAKLNLIELQSWGEHVWSFMHERAKVYKNGQLVWISGTVGSHLSKVFSDVDLMEPGSEARISGFYFSDREQHFDLDTQQNHLAPHTFSDLLYKGVLFGKSKTVWQGMIYVAPHAIKTDGYQANRNLILSKDAKVNSIPGLEILAGDVRCSHGATVSKIEDAEMFYLQSRGIPKQEAEKLIVKGFFNTVFERIPDDVIIDRCTKIIENKMENHLFRLDKN